MKSTASLWVGALWQAAMPITQEAQQLKPVEATPAPLTPPVFEANEPVTAA